MNQERYWRNLIADEIKAEMSRVESYYMKKGMNSGGMSTEEHTRLNIFRLCESIARAMKDSPDAPADIPKEVPTVDIPPTFTSSTVEPMPEPVIEDIAPDTIIQETTIQEAIPTPDPIQKLVKDTPRQNQFGEFL